jgi:hypothetical protein
MDAREALTKIEAGDQVNERLLLLIFGVVELCWFAGIVYTMTVIL